MNKKIGILTLLLISVGFALQADPPKPPLGKRWVMNHDFSDEFNGTRLDTTKWLDYHPTWIGREPGLFMQSQVSVGDGYLQLRGEKMEQDTIVGAYGKERRFNVKCAAVVSKKSVFLGFYECRIKAAATSMSTTFWFSGKGGVGPNDCDEYGLEWDIQECIGRNGDFKGSYFANGMHSNAHYWYTDCDGKKHDYRATQVVFNDEEVASKDFHTYGGWWRDESSASYYYDNSEPKHQKFYDVVSKKPFDKPMYMRLVSETYPFPWIELPNDEELADTSKNVVRYDWVRAYKLVDVNDDNAAEKRQMPEIFTAQINFPQFRMEMKSASTLNIPLTYKANRDREIHLVLSDPDGNKIKEYTINAYQGYANMMYALSLDKTLVPDLGYTLSADIRPIGESKKAALYSNLMIININE